MIEDQEHDIWLGYNCGLPHGFCTCGEVFHDGDFEELGMALGRHLDEAIG